MKCCAENIFFNLYMYCIVEDKETAEKRMHLTHVRDINSSSDNFREIKWKLKGSILEQKSQKHLKIWSIRKAQHLPAVVTSSFHGQHAKHSGPSLSQL